MFSLLNIIILLLQINVVGFIYSIYGNTLYTHPSTRYLCRSAAIFPCGVAYWTSSRRFLRRRQQLNDNFWPGTAINFVPVTVGLLLCIWDTKGPIPVAIFRSKSITIGRLFVLSALLFLLGGSLISFVLRYYFFGNGSEGFRGGYA